MLVAASNSVMPKITGVICTDLAKSYALAR
jgi:hypothetical protein